MDYRIFHVRIDINACDLHTGGVRTYVRESALKVDTGRKLPCRTGEPNLLQRRASPMLYQLSYIPEVDVQKFSSLVCLCETRRYHINRYRRGTDVHLLCTN